MRILFVVSPARFFLSHRLPLALAARDAGYDVHIAVPDEAEAAQVEATGLPTHRIPLQRGKSGLSADWKLLGSLRRLFRELKPDLVHLVTIKPVLFGGLAAQLEGVPAVVAAVSGLGHVFIERGPVAALRRTAVLAAYRVALAHPNKRVIFQNDDDRNLFVRRRTVPPSAATIIRGSGVDTKLFAPTPEPDILEGPPRVVLPARMLREKGVGEFIAAAEQLRREGVAARCTLVGETDAANPSAIDANELRRWYESGVIEWWGHRSDMPNVYAQSHIVCLPSYREGLSKTLLEAMACGRPIVTTDVPGCRDAVRDGVNGLLVPARNSGALADALKLLIQDAPLRLELGARGREICEREFGIDGVVAQTLRLYDELLGH